MTCRVDRMTWIVSLLLACAWGSLALAAPSDAHQAKKKPAAKPVAKETKKEIKKETEESTKPATYCVKKGPFKIEVNLDGYFQAEKTSEVFVRPQEWNQLTVLKAAEHGAMVKRGDLLLRLTPRKSIAPSPTSAPTSNSPRWP